MSCGILHGLRIVEASAFVAAPLGGMTLAQMGADVIRIDLPQGGLDYRRWPVTREGTSLFWSGLNKGKRSVVIDVTTAQGRELAEALVTAPGDDAGILLTNFPPRGWLDFDRLKERREDLIQLTIQGDRHGSAAVDYTVNARTGLPYLTGPENIPGAVNHVLPAWDLITGQMAALGLLAAERQRRQTGKGQHVKLALEDVALASLGHLGFIAEAQLGTARARYGNALFGAFGRDFVTLDGERLMIVGLTLKQWRSLCAATDITESIRALGVQRGVDLDEEGERFHARDAIAALLARWVGSRTFAEVATVFEARSVCWSRYQSVKQLVDQDPACSLSNPMFRTVDHPGVGPLLTPGTPFDFGSGRVPAQAAPSLGEHTDEVLTQVLGLTGAELERLRIQRIVGLRL